MLQGWKNASNVNPITKQTFEALPRIYGRSGRKKYAMKYLYEYRKQLMDVREVISIPRQKSLDSVSQAKEMNGECNYAYGQQPTSQGTAFKHSPTNLSRFKRYNTEQQVYAQSLSKPKKYVCEKIRCPCHSQSLEEAAKRHPRRRAAHFKDKLPPLQLPPLQLPAADENETKHKIRGFKNTENNKHFPCASFGIFELVKDSAHQRRGTLPVNQILIEEKIQTRRKRVQSQQSSYRDQNQNNKSQIYHLQQHINIDLPSNIHSRRYHQIAIQCNPEQSMQSLVNSANEQQKTMPQNLKEAISNNSATSRRSNMQSKASQYELIVANKKERVQVATQFNEQQIQNVQRNTKDKTIKSKFNISGIQCDLSFEEDESLRLSQPKPMLHPYFSQEASDDDQSNNSLSSTYIQQKLFQQPQQTMFSELSKKQRRDKRVMSSKKVKKQPIELKDAKGLFTIPEEDQYITYLKGYEAMGKNFKMRKLVGQDNFKVVRSDDGVYFGEIKENLKEGAGLMVTDREIFQGNFSKDVKVVGYQRNIDGVYKGEFLNGLRQGFGTFEWNNGEKFEGQWSKGTKEGWGVWKSPKGDYYEGEWRMNRQHGKGVFKHKLSTYRGQFKHFLKEGHGEEVFANGDWYEGQYKKGKPHGRGRYKWSDGSLYEGEFVEGLRVGKGSWRTTNGVFYQGDFFNDFKHGQGKETYSNGEIFQGTFIMGIRGEGVFN